MGGNALRFGTEEQAETYAKDLASRWTLVRDTRVVPSDDPVTSRGETGGARGPDA